MYLSLCRLSTKEFPNDNRPACKKFGPNGSPPLLLHTSESRTPPCSLLRLKMFLKLYRHPTNVERLRSIVYSTACIDKGRELNTTFLSQTFWAPPGYPRKSQDIPPNSLVSLRFEGHTELFGPHPFT